MEGQETLVAVVLTVVMDILEQAVQIQTAVKLVVLVVQIPPVMTTQPKAEKVEIAEHLAIAVRGDK